MPANTFVDETTVEAKAQGLSDKLVKYEEDNIYFSTVVKHGHTERKFQSCNIVFHSCFIAFFQINVPFLAAIIGI